MRRWEYVASEWYTLGFLNIASDTTSMEYSLKFYFPKWHTEMKEYEEAMDLLNKLNNEKKIEYNTHVLDDEQEKQLKESALYAIAVFNKIRIGQTRRSKSLHPILLLCNNTDQVLTFYPQSRRGDREITIKEFLENLLNGRLVCLHKIPNNLIS